MAQYTFTVKIELENEMRPDILEYLLLKKVKELNVNVSAGKEEHPIEVDVKGKKC